MRIQTCTDVWFWFLGLKSLVQVKSFKIQGLIFQVPTCLTLLKSSMDEKDNSKKPLPIDVIPHLPIDFQIPVSLTLKSSTLIGEEPFGRMILPWRLCLHAANPASYSSSGISIVKWSPFKQGLGSRLTGMSQMLLTACAKVFCWEIGLGLAFVVCGGGVDESSWRHGQERMKGLTVEAAVVMVEDEKYGGWKVI